jgi:hypothetical protein
MEIIITSRCFNITIMVINLSVVTSIIMRVSMTLTIIIVN